MADQSQITLRLDDSVQLSPSCDDCRLAFSTPLETLVYLHMAIHQHGALSNRPRNAEWLTLLSDRTDARPGNVFRERAG